MKHITQKETKLLMSTTEGKKDESTYRLLSVYNTASQQAKAMGVTSALTPPPDLDGLKFIHEQPQGQDCQNELHKYIHKYIHK